MYGISVAAGCDRNCSSVLQAHGRKEGKEVKCAGGRALEGQDRESIWKHLFPTYVCLCIDCLLLVLPHLKEQRLARRCTLGCSNRQGFWKSVILTKYQLDENPVVIILFPHKATSCIWIYPGLIFKLGLAVFNCVSITGINPKPSWNIKEYCFMSWREKIIKTSFTRWKISVQLSLFCACNFSCVCAPCHGERYHLDLVPGIHTALW